jgi:hypothetical protein
MSTARRSKAVSPLAANALGSAPAFTLTTEQLIAVVKSAVAEALAESTPAPAPTPLLLDCNGLARALGCSPSKIDNLRKKGLPTERFGDSPAFDLVTVREWVRQQKECSS